jgi:hypothetical protein
MTRIFSDVCTYLDLGTLETKSWWKLLSRMDGKFWGGRGYGAGNVFAGTEICTLDHFQTVLCHMGMMSATSFLPE